MSTALIAFNILSGVGEVKTSPHTAASNMPSATYPACAGSCPLPPPDTIATPLSFLFFFTTIVSSLISNCGFAIERPFSISAKKCVFSFISFFIVDAS